MTIEKLKVVLNKMDSKQNVYIEKLKEKENINFEELTDIRELFKTDCLEIYISEFEKEFIEKLTEKNKPRLRRIQNYIESEIFRLAYNKKWNII